MRSGAETWPEAKMMSLGEEDVSQRSTRRAMSKGVSARLAMGVSLACLVAVALVGMMHTPRPVEDVIVGMNSGRGQTLRSAATSSMDEDAIVKRAVQQAVAGAARVAKEEVQRDVQQAVKDAIRDAVSANSRLSAPALVKKLAVTGDVEAKRAAGKEAAEYREEMKHITGELDSQIGSAIGAAHANEKSTFKGMKPPKYVDIDVNNGDDEQKQADARAQTENAKPAHKARNAKISKAVDDKFLKMASEVLNHETKPSPKMQQIAHKQAVQDRARHQKEMASEIQQYKALERQIHGENDKLYNGKTSNGRDDPNAPFRKLDKAPNAREREAIAMHDFKKLQQVRNAKKVHEKHQKHAALQKAIAEESAGRAYAEKKEASDKKVIAKATKDVKPKAVQTKKTSKGITTPLIKDEKGHVIPVTSKKNPVYVHEEARRDDEAQRDLKKLQKLQEAKKKAREARNKDPAAEETHTDRGKEADEYLKIMEKEKKKEAAAAPKAAQPDRNALAEHYLKQLMKTGSTAVKWVSDKISGAAHTPKAHEHQGDRDEEASKDLSLLAKNKALVKKGDKVEKVKLSPAAVHGVDKVAEERKALEAEAKAHAEDRNELAQKDLKQLKASKKVSTSMLHPHGPTATAKHRKI